MYGFIKYYLILILFSLPQVSCFTLSLKCFSFDSDNCPDEEFGPLLQFPHPLRAGPVLLILLFFPLVPSSCGVLHGSIYSFSLVRYSVCSQLLFCMHFSVWRWHISVTYLWHISEERCTPRPPTPLPSCSPLSYCFLQTVKKIPMYFVNKLK